MCLDGKHIAPYLDTSITKDEKDRQNKEILDKGANTVAAYWTGATFDGHPVVPIPIPSEVFVNKFGSADEVVDFLKASLSNIRSLGKH